MELKTVSGMIARGLSGVEFAMDDALSRYVTNVGERAISAEVWQAAISVRLAGCPNLNLIVYVQIPEGYTLTTPARLDADRKQHDEFFYFGFVTN